MRGSTDKSNVYYEHSMAGISSTVCLSSVALLSIEMKAMAIDGSTSVPATDSINVCRGVGATPIEFASESHQQLLQLRIGRRRLHRDDGHAHASQAAAFWGWLYRDGLRSP